MRLICPNCDAEYEVDASLLPAQGREVQCSNCGQTWFQHPIADQDAEDDVARSPELAPKRPATDPKALDILHEEVERETQARAAETSTLETQGDLGLQEPAPAQKQAAVDAHQEIVESEDVDPDDALMEITRAGPEEIRSEGTKRELLPDIEEINSTLASAPDPVHDEEEDEEVALPRRRSRFRTGFGLMLIVSAAIVGAYVYAPEIAENFPQTGDSMVSYVKFIDRLRISLDTGAQALLKQLTALTERVGSSS